MATGPIEAKVATGSVTYLAAGYLASVLITIVPWLRDHLTADQQANLPIFISWALGFIVAYYTPHTHRADLVQVAPPEPLGQQQDIPHV